MKILIVGSGGREHALAWKIGQSPLIKKIYCAPGNGGIQNVAECVDIPVSDIDGLIQFAKDNKIDLTVVGPEAPLVAGIVDAFEANELKVFGPNQAAAQLEGSKVFSKEFMYKYNIPTAAFKTFTRAEDAHTFLEHTQFPVVVKADGLAAGKGVIICEDVAQARKAVDQIMTEKIFNEAGDKLIIEECLEGEEASIIAISDGTDYVILESAQDHKRIFDDDLGPNTGGMGAYSPAPVVDKELMTKIDARVIGPTIRGMKREGTPFKGVLYAGLMMTKNGPSVLEYNVRFGDPEIQAILPRLKNDLIELMDASCEGRLNGIQLIWEKQTCVCVVMSSGGYPGEYAKGLEISGLASAEEDALTKVFHAGTKDQDGRIVTNGGRVLGVTSMGKTVSSAIEKAYVAVEKIKFDRCFFRRDIGAKALAQLSSVQRTTHQQIP